MSMKAFFLALALFLSVSLVMCEQFTTDNAVLTKDSDGAYQVIFWAPTFDNFLSTNNGIIEIGSISQHSVVGVGE